MKTALYSFFLFVLLASCTKDNSTPDPASLLPPETQTGANTFGCLINGKLLIPRDGTGTFGGADSGAILWGDPTGSQQYTEIDVHDFKSDRTANILIHLQNIDQIGNGNYIINESNGLHDIDGYNHNYLHCRIFDEATNSYRYYRSYANSGVIKITKYELIPNVKLIISGIFSCKVKNSTNPNDIIDISKGRFDFNGATLPNKFFPKKKPVTGITSLIS
jgi:hypothetical protein